MSIFCLYFIEGGEDCPSTRVFTSDQHCLATHIRKFKRPLIKCQILLFNNDFLILLTFYFHSLLACLLLLLFFGFWLKEWTEVDENGRRKKLPKTEGANFWRIYFAFFLNPRKISCCTFFIMSFAIKFIKWVLLWR